MQRTKGEWLLSKTTSGYILYGEDDGKDIALIYDDRNECGEANANLMEAAPDMQDAIQSVLTTLDNLIYDDTIGGCQMVLRLALAKSKGRV